MGLDDEEIVVTAMPWMSMVGSGLGLTNPHIKRVIDEQEQVIRVVGSRVKWTIVRGGIIVGQGYGQAKEVQRFFNQYRNYPKRMYRYKKGQLTVMILEIVGIEGTAPPKPELKPLDLSYLHPTTLDREHEAFEQEVRRQTSKAKARTEFWFDTVWSVLEELEKLLK